MLGELEDNFTCVVHSISQAVMTWILPRTQLCFRLMVATLNMCTLRINFVGCSSEEENSNSKGYDVFSLAVLFFVSRHAIKKTFLILVF